MPLAMDRYRNFEKLAEGGMGEVYRAEVLGIDNVNKVVAVKLIRADLMENPRFEQLFVQEVKISLTLSHANIVQVFDVGRINNRYFMSMEFVDGWTLTQVLKWCRQRGDLLPHKFAMFVAVEILKALDYAHRRTDQEQTPLGLIHRDVSPSNILISREGEVKLTDFGVAKSALTARFSNNNTIVGKAAYMSPEQRSGQSVDRRTDIFSLGAVLYQIIVGRPPFETGEFPFTQQRKVTEVDGIEGVLESIIVRSLAHDSNERYSTAAEMREALEQAALDERELLSSNQLAAFLEDLAKDHEPLTVVTDGTIDASADTRPSSPDKRFNDLLGLELMRVEQSAVVEEGLSIFEAHSYEPSDSGPTKNERTTQPRSEKSPTKTSSGGIWKAAALIAIFVMGAVIAIREAPLAPRASKVAATPPIETPAPPAPAPKEPEPTTTPASTPTTAVKVKPAPKTKKTIPQKWGTLSLNTEPWSNVAIDGESIGVTPVLQLKLKAGSHKIKLTNPPAKLEKILSIVLKSNEHRQLSIDLRQQP